MVKVKFKATADMDSYLFAKGGVKEGTYGGKATRKIIGPEILHDGDEVETTVAIKGWLLNQYPDNFTEVKPKAAPKPKSD